MGQSSLNNIYLPAVNAAFRRIGDDVVIVDTAHNEMMTLNRTGTEIWSLLDGRSVDEIARALTDLFDVSHDQAVDGIFDFVHEMEQRNLVVCKKSEVDGNKGAEGKWE